MTRAQTGFDEAGWTADELARRERVLDGLAVVANATKGRDAKLIDWAFTAGLLVRIHRPRRFVKESDPLIWRNRFAIGKHGDRDEVCDKFAADLAARLDLLARIPELRGKVLLCWCHPERCHGHHLAALANAAEVAEAPGSGNDYPFDNHSVLG